MRIYVDRDDLPLLSDDEAYLHDIIGMTIVDHSSDKVLGILDAVQFPSEQMLWSICTEDGQEILLPAVEEFIVSFDMEERCIYVSPPEGLLDLYLSDNIEKP